MNLRCGLRIYLFLGVASISGTRATCVTSLLLEKAFFLNLLISFCAESNCLWIKFLSAVAFAACRV